jgi:hypothetical protein
MKIDIKERYYKIRIKKDKEWKIVWKSRLGHYEQLIISFSLINVLTSF